MNGSWIYLIEAENGLVKIGRAANVRDRATTVRTHSPVATRLIATWKGGEEEELALHHRFSNYRFHGEWFEVVGGLADFVASVRGKNIPDIPEWDELFYAARERLMKRRNMLARGIAKAKKISLLHGGMSA